MCIRDSNHPRTFCDWQISSWHVVIYWWPGYPVELEKRLADGRTLIESNLQGFWITDLLHIEDQGIAFHGADSIRAKVVDHTVLVQASKFEYLGCNVPYTGNHDVVKKLHKFNNMCRTIWRTLNATSKETRLRSRPSSRFAIGLRIGL